MQEITRLRSRDNYPKPPDHDLMLQVGVIAYGELLLGKMTA